MDSRSEVPGGSTLAAFAGAVLIGGTNFIAVKFSNEEIDPLSGAALRFSAATVLLFLVVAIGRYGLPRGRSLVGVAVYGALGIGISYALLYYAVVGLGAGPTSVVVAATPLATLVLAVLQKQERMTGRGIVGGVLAVIGIGVLSLQTAQIDVEASYMIAAILGVTAIGQSSIVIRQHRDIHPMSTNAVGMLVGSAILIVAALLFGQDWTLPQSTKVWSALVWLVVPGSIGLFYLVIYVVKRWTASATMYAVASMPVVTVSLGALVADEPLTLEVLVGGALVLAAVYIGAIYRPRVVEAPSAEPA
jgi:drug/metabolite transporter (DMT)-like permease